MMCVRMVIALMTILALMARAELHAQVPPVEAFGKLPQLSGVRLSPKGTRIGYFVPLRGQLTLIAERLDGKDKAKPFIAEFPGGEFDWFEWVNEERLILAVSFPDYRGAGVPTVETRLIAVDVDGSNPKDLLTRGSRGGFIHQIQTNVISTLPNDPSRILVSFGEDAYTVNINSKTVRRAAHGSEYVANWVADGSGNIRTRHDYVRDNRKIRLRGARGGAWEVIADYELDVEPDFEPLAFGETDDKMVVISGHESGIASLFEFDTSSKEFTRRLSTQSQYDVAETLIHPKTERVVGYAYIDDQLKHHYFDSSARNVYESVQRKLPDAINSIEHSTHDYRTHVVRSTAPTKPDTYYLFDRSSNQLVKLGAAYRDLRANDLANVVPYRYSSDGRTISAYVTLPKGVQLDGDRQPLVVLPHKFLHGRDYIRFGYLAQFLASRGWAVLQPNFRGSGGFGAGFRRAAFKQWGLGIQDDVTAGVQSLVASGFADPSRICIVGSGFGGYVALMGAVKTPSLYKCAAGIGAITDLLMLLADRDKYRFNQFSERQLGSRGGDTSRLKATSPYFQASEIEIPVLLVHGDADRNVPVKHSEAMARALRKAGKNHKLVVLEDGDDRFMREHHRVRFLKELETFLKQHLN